MTEKNLDALLSGDGWLNYQGKTYAYVRDDKGQHVFADNQTGVTFRIPANSLRRMGDNLFVAIDRNKYCWDDGSIIIPPEN